LPRESRISRARIFLIVVSGINNLLKVIYRKIAIGKN